MLYLTEYQLYFNENYQLLRERYSRLLELIDEHQGYNLDVHTYFDMIMVQLRALLLDDKWNNNKAFKSYTVQGILSMTIDDGVQSEIQKLLDTILIKGPEDCNECLVSYNCDEEIDDCPVKTDLTFQKAVRMITDKSICHYDNYYRVNASSWDCVQMVRRLLLNKTEPNNLFNIMNALFDLLKDGIELRLLDELDQAKI